MTVGEAFRADAPLVRPGLSSSSLLEAICPREESKLFLSLVTSKKAKGTDLAKVQSCSVMTGSEGFLMIKTTVGGTSHTSFV